MTKHRLRFLAFAGVVAAGAFGVATAVQAAIPDGSGTIHGCYTKTAPPGGQAGALRLIDTALGQSCQLSEGSVNWSQTGPQGPQGPQGRQGPKGATGPKGDKGDPGANAYFAGTGLGLSGGTTFNIQPGYRLPQGCGEGQSPAIASFAWTCSTPASSDESCSGGKFVNGINAVGDVTCASPTVTTSGADVWSAYTESADAPEAWGAVVSLTLPAGTYFLTFTGTAADEAGTNGDGQVAVTCQNDGDGSAPLRTLVAGGAPASGGLRDEVGPNIGIAVSNISTLSATGVINMECSSEVGSDVIEDATLTAIRVGTLH